MKNSHQEIQLKDILMVVHTQEFQTIMDYQTRIFSSTIGLHLCMVLKDTTMVVDGIQEIQHM